MSSLINPSFNGMKPCMDPKLIRDPESKKSTRIFQKRLNLSLDNMNPCMDPKLIRDPESKKSTRIFQKRLNPSLDNMNPCMDLELIRASESEKGKKCSEIFQAGLGLSKNSSSRSVSSSTSSSSSSSLLKPLSVDRHRQIMESIKEFTDQGYKNSYGYTLYNPIPLDDPFMIVISSIKNGDIRGLSLSDEVKFEILCAIVEHTPDYSGELLSHIKSFVKSGFQTNSFDRSKTIKILSLINHRLNSVIYKRKEYMNVDISNKLFAVLFENGFPELKKGDLVKAIIERVLAFAASINDQKILEDLFSKLPANPSDFKRCRWNSTTNWSPRDVELDRGRIQRTVIETFIRYGTMESLKYVFENTDLLKGISLLQILSTRSYFGAICDAVKNGNHSMVDLFTKQIGDLDRFKREFSDTESQNREFFSNPSNPILGKSDWSVFTDRFKLDVIEKGDIQTKKLLFKRDRDFAINVIEQMLAVALTKKGGLSIILNIIKGKMIFPLSGPHCPIIREAIKKAIMFILESQPNIDFKDLDPFNRKLTYGGFSLGRKVSLYPDLFLPKNKETMKLLEEIFNEAKLSVHNLFTDKIDQAINYKSWIPNTLAIVVSEFLGHSKPKSKFSDKQTIENQEEVSPMKPLIIERLIGPEELALNGLQDNGAQDVPEGLNLDNNTSVPLGEEQEVGIGSESEKDVSDLDMTGSESEDDTPPTHEEMRQRRADNLEARLKNKDI